MKLLFFVEGDLEEKELTGFIRRWLEPRLKCRIGLKAVKFKGCMDLVKAAPQKAKMRLADEKVVAIFSLIDLYCQNLYPNCEQSVDERYAWGKQHIEQLVDDSRFKHFFAVHETEA
jgi:hypothetical protein